MYLSIFSDEVEGDFRETLPMLSSWGLKYVDLRGRVLGKALHDLNDEELSEVRGMLDREGMKIGALQSSLAKVHLPNSERQEAEQEKLEGIIRTADALDCRLVRVFNFWQPKGEEANTLHTDGEKLEQVMEMFRPLAKRGKEAGLIYAFENCGQSCEEIAALLKALDNPDWGLAWDVHNGWDSPSRKKDEVLHIAQNARRSKMVHVKAKSILPELDGEMVPWNRVLAACRTAGLDAPVSVETHNPRGSALTNTQASLRMVERLRGAMPGGKGHSVFKAAAPKPEIQRSYEDNPVGFVVVGLGMGRGRSRQILTTPGCELAGVCDVREEVARDVGETLGVPWTTDLKPWLEDDRAEVVFSVTPTGLHKDICVPALNAGKHAITTKPMEATLAACDEMVAASDQNRKLMAIDFQCRNHPRVLDLKAAVEAGVFGRLLSVTAEVKILREGAYFQGHKSWHGTKKLDGGGVFSNQAIHNIDEIVYCLGAPDEVTCNVWTQNHDIEGEDLGVATWRYKSGLVVSFYATTCFPQKTWYERLEIHGTEAAYTSARGGPIKDDVRWFLKDGWTEEAPVKGERKWLNCMDNLADAIRTGAPLLSSGRDGRATQAVLDAMYRSSDENGRWLAVETEVPAAAMA